jgi:A/G-specific adenine glycosylase
MSCSFKDSCHAFLNDKIKELPVKKLHVSLTERYFNYLVITNGKKIILRKRTQNDIWKMLYDFPLIEVPDKMSEAEIMNTPSWKQMLCHTTKIKIKNVSGLYRHILTHQRIYARFFRIEMVKSPDSLHSDFISVDINSLEEYAVPRLIERYLHDNPI